MDERMGNRVYFNAGYLIWHTVHCRHQRREKDLPAATELGPRKISSLILYQSFTKIFKGDAK